MMLQFIIQWRDFQAYQKGIFLFWHLRYSTENEMQIIGIG